jgi:pSer/pThr/pTyr-binding forkhead associated (FHA) protein
MVYSATQAEKAKSKRSTRDAMVETRAIVALDDRRYVLDGPTASLGRSKECDCVLDDPNVSRRHAELRREGSTWWLVDLDSTNGTELNGKRVQKAKLSEGDTITLGATDLVFGKASS